MYTTHWSLPSDFPRHDVEVIEVVRTRLLQRGEGVEGDPVRRVTQYWSRDGELLAEHDPRPATNSCAA